jgi:hypothetical protein
MNIAKYFSDGLSVIPCGDSGHSVLHGCNQSSRIYEQVNGNWITGSLFHEPCKEAMASMQECIWAGKDFHYTWADREYVIKFSILKDFHLEEYLKHGKVITLN